MITEMSLEHPGDGWHREAHERALMWVEPLTGFDQSGAGDLQEVFLVLAAMRKPPGQRLCQPQMGGDHFVEDPLAFGWSGGLSLKEEVLGVFGQRFAREAGLSGRYQERISEIAMSTHTLRDELRAWRASRPPLDVNTRGHSNGNPLNYPKNEEVSEKFGCVRRSASCGMSLLLTIH